MSDTARIMDALRRAVRALRSANLDAKRELGVSAARLFVLRQLAGIPGQSLTQLAQRTHTAQSSVSEVVSRLVEDGLVTKQTSAEDHRRVILQLTPAGEAIADRAERTVQERLIAGLGQLDESELRALADSLDTWLTAADLGDTPATMFFESERAMAQQP